MVKIECIRLTASVNKCFSRPATNFAVNDENKFIYYYHWARRALEPLPKVNTVKTNNAGVVSVM
jgi:hypothetical protein